MSDWVKILLEYSHQDRSLLKESFTYMYINVESIYKEEYY